MASKQRYQVVQRVDVGGMAEIYRGKGLSLQGIEKTVAIKRILPALTSKPKFVTMFLDEARLAMRLNHANIVQVFDVGRSGGTYFLIMEFVEGPNLKRLLEGVMERGERVPTPIALFIAAEVCKGLQYAHNVRDEQGRHLRIIHRDISPSNILLSGSGEVKITDFGLAKAMTHVELTDPGIIKGKFSYLCPEAIAEDAEIDHRADIFSLGIILWEMLAGRRLFVAETDTAILDMVERAEVPSLRKLAPDVPPELEDVVNRALAKSAANRFSSAAAFGDAVVDILFKRGMKVSAHDLAEFLHAQKSSGEGSGAEDPVQRIRSLLREEVLNLSMVGSEKRGAQLQVDGSKPIVGELMRLEKLKTASQFRNIWEIDSAEDVKASDLLTARERSNTERTGGDHRATMFWLGGLTAVFLILLVVYFATR